MANFWETAAGKALISLLFQWFMEWLANANKADAVETATKAGAAAKAFMTEYNA